MQLHEDGQRQIICPYFAFGTDGGGYDWTVKDSVSYACIGRPSVVKGDTTIINTTFPFFPHIIMLSFVG